jgi:hypothetical protein
MFILEKVLPADLTRVAADLPNHGTSLKLTGSAPNRWQGYGHEVFFYADYNPSFETLTVAITKKPFFISEKHIEDGLRAAIWPPVAKTAPPAAHPAVIPAQPGGEKPVGAGAAADAPTG